LLRCIGYYKHVSKAVISAHAATLVISVHHVLPKRGGSAAIPAGSSIVQLIEGKYPLTISHHHIRICQHKPRHRTLCGVLTQSNASTASCCCICTATPPQRVICMHG
jgi:hypothetical protein